MYSKYFSLLSLLSTSLVAGATDPLEIIGTKWFNSNTGEEFIIKGVAYQPGGSGSEDPIANTAQLANAIPLFTELGINAIRVYETSANLNHDQGMQMLSDAGIYVIFDLSNPNSSINRNDPTYDTNTMAYFAGNEVNNSVNNTDSNPFVKATVRDMKAHMKAQKRYIPIGYANNDDSQTLQNIVNYFNCGSEDDRIDFFGYNIYSWCKPTDTMQTSGYDKKTAMFENYGIPAFFSEYGCNTDPPRQFDDIPYLYSSPMNNVFSGGLVYEFTEESNNYGLVQANGNNFTIMPDFTTYKNQLSKLKLSPTNKSSYTPPSNNGTTCPSEGSDWQASNNLPPTPSVDACNCLMGTYGCIVSSSFNVTAQSSSVSQLFQYACGQGKVDCSPLTANGTSGVYGNISFCDPTTQLSYALNSMYTQSNKNKDTCTSNGTGSIQSPSSNSESTCLSKAANLQQSAGSGSGSSGSSNNGQLLLPSFASLGIATIIAVLFI
ncbi:carbohydrate-binding module family 43 protein [Conidiobolus coronatus NRRL 28638]|uniref:1,3-beta-glucanosyltransferase n=1 Tax=Conidiobolus coronatus (strain ATCC 28846 / CBS 209.66 / NRRL 28638) TaxID=796925 RepID=A0A137P8B0_CONC2|nr:carbohydrate-binding module family 43 protein [Conidiobolus coronatus NRRL 28638]|eukprot:KXN71184.1 carbohydrate-binding module family 43 protein [Conidiobolus coronatus NRRL 28638]